MREQVCVSREVLELLWGEPAHLMVLYMWLVDAMDDATCIVGKGKRRINEQFVKERLEIHPRPGLASRAEPSREVGRSALRRLEKLGLIEPRGDMVFFLPAEARRFSVQNIYNQNKADLQPVYNQAKLSNNSDLREPEKSLQPEGMGIYNPPLINQSINQPEAFAMQDSWQPSEHFGARASMMGFETDARDLPLLQAALVDVKLYWMANRPNEQRNQAGWERTLLQTMVRMRQHGSKKTDYKPRSADFGGGAVGIPALPRDDDALMGWAARNGARQPARGESWLEYRRALQNWRELRIDELRRGKQEVMA